MTIISPSILTADFTNLSQEVERFNKSQAQWLHYDVMDGSFVPNLSFGPAILKQINKITNKFIDVHIMVVNPLETIDYFNGCKIDMLTFHWEAVDHNTSKALEVINKIKSKGYQAGICVKPKTDITELADILPYVDLVLVMTVEPGFGGQKFMGDMMPKTDWLYQQKNEHNYQYIIEIDGGVNGETAKIAKEHHCEALVAGSYCFNHPVSFDEAVNSII